MIDWINQSALFIDALADFLMSPPIIYIVICLLVYLSTNLLRRLLH